MDYAYHVECPTSPSMDLLGIYANAKDNAARALIASAAQTIEHRLKWEPLRFGEPRYHNQDIGIIRVAVVAPLVVHFAVDEKKNVVHTLRYQILEE